MGVIFQGFNLVKRLRVLDNVMIGTAGADPSAALMALRVHGR
jgi:ABC-type phosphate/phosphonate transport system ATPase subunit